MTGKTIEGIKFYTYEEVAQITGTTIRTVQIWKRDGHITGRRIGRKMHVYADSLSRFLKEK